jgi:hypothetical protein
MLAGALCHTHTHNYLGSFLGHTLHWQKLKKLSSEVFKFQRDLNMFMIHFRKLPTPQIVQHQITGLLVIKCKGSGRNNHDLIEVLRDRGRIHENQ